MSFSLLVSQIHYSDERQTEKTSSNKRTREREEKKYSPCIHASFTMIDSLHCWLAFIHAVRNCFLILLQMRNYFVPLPQDNKQRVALSLSLCSRFLTLALPVWKMRGEHTQFNVLSRNRTCTQTGEIQCVGVLIMSVRGWDTLSAFSHLLITYTVASWRTLREIWCDVWIINQMTPESCLDSSSANKQRYCGVWLSWLYLFVTKELSIVLCLLIRDTI